MVTNIPQFGISTPYEELVGSSKSDMMAEFANYAELGVQYLRVDFRWSWIEWNENEYFWNGIDSVVDAAQTYGIEVIGIINNQPSWLNDRSFTSTSSQKAYGEFAGIAAERFDGRVNIWEIYNEQNLDNITPEHYTAMMKEAYNAIKDVSSENIVVSGGLSPVPSSVAGKYGAVEYLDRMYAAGAKEYMDAVGFHPYTFPLMPNDPAAWNGWQIMEDGVRDTMNAYNDGNKQVWITELGAPTAGGNNAVTQEQQAEIMRQSIEIGREYDWMGPILWYSYQDRGNNINDTEAWFGLVGPNGEKKESYDTFKQLAHQQAELLADQKNNPEDFEDIVHAQTHVFTQDELPSYVPMAFNTDDKIDLSAIDAIWNTSKFETFKFVGSEWLTGAGQIGFYHNHQNNTTSIVGWQNDDGSKKIELKLIGIHTLSEDNFIFSSPQSTVLYGTAEDDILSGYFTKNSDDVIDGKNGNDTLYGHSGDDKLYGANGNDLIYGGSGDDLINGGSGNDKLIGNSGNDTFQFSDLNVGFDTILDFSEGDRIDLSQMDADNTKAGKQSFDFISSNWLSEATDLGFYKNYEHNFTSVKGRLNATGEDSFTIRLEGLHDITINDLIL